MLIKERKIKGVFEINLESREDHRGLFMRTYDDKVFKKYDLHQKWVQENHSYSEKKGVLRGLHFQFSPYTETKLIRVVGGEIFVVFVDLRKDSSMFGRWDSVMLSEDNRKMSYVPRGIALGMCTLREHCTILYKMDSYYAPKYQGAIKWDDVDLGIDWPIENPIISKRDSEAQSFREFKEKYGGLKV